MSKLVTSYYLITKPVGMKMRVENYSEEPPKVSNKHMMCFERGL